MNRSKIVRIVGYLGFLSMTLCRAQGQDEAALDRAVRMNQIQVIGTHNSYHSGLAPSELAQLRSEQPRMAQALDYSHPPLAQQLSAGIRQIELDVFADPEGGRFVHPQIVNRVAAAGLPPGPTYDPSHEMKKPGFKVMHLQDVDQRSSCLTFIDCLGVVHAWSMANPGHLPLFILVEYKNARIKDADHATTMDTATPASFDALEKEILHIFTSAEMVTPDQVRGRHATLPEAIRDGWPTLAAARGKVVFLLDNRDLVGVLKQGHPALHGRILFSNEAPGTPEAAFTEVNNGSQEEIAALVRQGYLVRTRADNDTMQARANNTLRREIALASGAQIISTDYPLSEPARWTGYSVSFPQGRMARCNTVTAAPACRDELLETSARHGR